MAYCAEDSTNSDVSRYVLGSTPRLKVITLDTEGEPFEPTEIRLSVKDPQGNIYTYSGAELTMASGYQFYIFHPLYVGWYQYEGWVKDGNGLEDAATKGFEIYDSVYPD